MIKRVTTAIFTAAVTLLVCVSTATCTQQTISDSPVPLSETPIVIFEPAPKLLPSISVSKPGVDHTPRPCPRVDGKAQHVLESYDDNFYICTHCRELVKKRYGFTEDDIYLMAQLLCGSGQVDGDGEYDIDFANSDRYDQINLVLCTVMNRVRSDVYPNTVEEVIMQRGQFAVMPRNASQTVSEQSLEIVSDWCDMYDLGEESIQTIPEDNLYFYGDGAINHSY